jgi:3-methyladenine DNA glycosylase AlkD
MLTEQDVLRELESLGTEQNRKIYRRHGVAGDLYGVSYAHLGTLKKRIKIDHGLARQLWASGNHDARILATMVADPALVDERLLEDWGGDLQYHVLADAFAELVSKSPLARSAMERWTSSPNESIGRAGWHLLARLATTNSSLADDDLAPYLAVIERDIHAQKDRLKEAMNSALIAIGSRSSALEAQALAAAARIGKVTVDHGETDCKTPDATAYIRKTRAKREQQRITTAG